MWFERETYFIYMSWHNFASLWNLICHFRVKGSKWDKSVLNSLPPLLHGETPPNINTNLAGFGLSSVKRIVRFCGRKDDGAVAATHVQYSIWRAKPQGVRLRPLLLSIPFISVREKLFFHCQFLAPRVFAAGAFWALWGHAPENMDSSNQEKGNIQFCLTLRQISIKSCSVA